MGGSDCPDRHGRRRRRDVEKCILKKDGGPTNPRHQEKGQGEGEMLETVDMTFSLYFATGRPPNGVPTNPRHQEGQGEEEILEIVDMGFLIFRHWKRNQSDQHLADAMLVMSSKRIVRLFGKYYRIMRMIGPSILLLYVQSTVCLFDPTKGLTMKTQTVQITIIKLLLLL